MTKIPKKRVPLPAEAFGRLVLALIGVAWLGIGVTALFQPEWTGGVVDFDLSSSELARFEFRAMYGGLSVALAGLHLFGVVRTRWLLPCLSMSALTAVGPAGGRIVALSAGDVPGGLGFLFLVIELAAMGLAVFAIARIRATVRAAATATPTVAKEAVAPAEEPEEPATPPEEA